MALLLGSAGCFPSEYLNRDQCHETLRIYTIPTVAPVAPHPTGSSGPGTLLPIPGTKEAWQPLTLRECVVQAIQTGRVADEGVCVLAFNPPIARATLEEMSRRSPQGQQCLPVTFGGSTEARVARVNYEKARVEFMLQVEELLLGVESAYWNLRFAYAVLQTREEAQRLAEKLYENAEAQFKLHQLSVPDLERLDEQRQLARAESNQALSAGAAGRPGVQEAQRQLRYAAGFLPGIGPSLVPVDEPANLVPLPMWEHAAATALKQRNELVRARLEVEAAKVAVEVCDPYERERAQLQYEQKLKAFEHQKDQVLFQLNRALIQASQAGEQLRIQEARYQAATRYFQAIAEKAETARFGDVKERLLAQRNQADALRDRYLAQLDWQLALVQLERQMGTFLAHHKITFEDKLVSLGKTSLAKKHQE